MKHVITILALLLATLSFAQNDNLNGKISVEKEQTIAIRDLKLSVTVDSVEDIERTFSVEDIKEIVEMADDNENITFEISLEDKSVKAGVIKSVSYKVKGNTNEKDGFLESVKRIRNASLNFYTDKELRIKN